MRIVCAVPLVCSEILSFSAHNVMVSAIRRSFSSSLLKFLESKSSNIFSKLLFSDSDQVCYAFPRLVSSFVLSFLTGRFLHSLKWNQTEKDVGKTTQREQSGKNSTIQQTLLGLGLSYAIFFRNVTQICAGIEILS